MLKSLRELVDFRKIIGDTVSRTVAGLLTTTVLFLAALGWAPTRNAIDDAVPIWLFAVGMLVEAAALLGWSRYRARRAARRRRPSTLEEIAYEGVLWPLAATLMAGGAYRYQAGQPMCPKDRTALGWIIDESDPKEKPVSLDHIWPPKHADLLLLECFACHQRFDLRHTGYAASGLINIVEKLAAGRTRSASATQSS